MLVKRALLISQMILLFFLTGCWDQIEIEQRAFSVGIGIDLKEKKTDKSNTIEMTQQLIVPSALNTAQGGGGGERAFRNLTKSGETIFSINRDMTNLTSRKLSATQLELVIFSEDVAKEPKLLANLMDIFLRELEMRRSIKVAIASGKAKDLLNVEPEHEKVPAVYMTRLLENKGSLITLEPVRFGEVQENFLDKTSFPIPLLKKMGSKSVEYDGFAVFHGPKSKVVGTLYGDEAIGVTLIRGKKQTGSIITNVDGNRLDNEILNIKSDISLINNDKNHLEFNVNIKVKAGIAEVFGSENVLSAKNHAQFEKALEDKIKEITKKSIDTLQNDLHADILLFYQYLYQYHYNLWESIKNNWDTGKDFFSKCDINVTVNARIDRPGDINRAQ